MSKSMIVSFWSNYSRCQIGAEWNFIKGYWDFSFTFLFWTIDFAKEVPDDFWPEYEIVETKKGKACS